MTSFAHCQGEELSGGISLRRPLLPSCDPPSQPPFAARTPSKLQTWWADPLFVLSSTLRRRSPNAANLSGSRAVRQLAHLLERPRLRRRAGVRRLCLGPSVSLKWVLTTLLRPLCSKKGGQNQPVRPSLPRPAPASLADPPSANSQVPLPSQADAPPFPPFSSYNRVWR